MGFSTTAPTEGADGSFLRSLRREEVDELLELEDRYSWRSLLADWGLIAASFALVARWPNPLTIVLALFVIGGRQLGLAVLMHEAAHRTLFRNRRFNDWAGNWLTLRLVEDGASVTIRMEDTKSRLYQVEAPGRSK